ncbi:hypothetical protein JW887_02110 [Candidatus Dojkabacteria bacterium]|nr:hypothetical protein [Candidatus Dojkabacteria bacterium]
MSKKTLLQKSKALGSSVANNQYSKLQKDSEKSEKKDAKFRSNRSKRWLIVGIVTVILGLIATVLIYGFNKNKEYESLSTKYIEKIDELSSSIYDESSKNLLVLTTDENSYSDMEKDIHDMMFTIDLINKLDSNPWYIFKSFVENRESVKEAVGLCNDISDSSYEEYQEYFDDVLSLEVEFVRLNSTYPKNTEDFEDRLAKFTEQRTKYEDLKARVDALDPKYEFSQKIKKSMIESIDKLIEKTQSIENYIQTLISIQNQYLAMYPSVNGVPDPRYFSAYDTASAADLNALKSTYSDAKLVINDYENTHSQVVYDFNVVLMQSTVELNEKLSKLSENVDKRTFEPGYIGSFVFSRDSESSTQIENINIVLDIKEDGKYSVSYYSNVESLEYNFINVENFTAEGNLDMETYSSTFEQEIAQETTFSTGRAGITKQSSKTAAVSITFEYGRYVVNIGSSVYNLRPGDIDEIKVDSMPSDQ